MSATLVKVAVTVFGRLTPMIKLRWIGVRLREKRGRCPLDFQKKRVYGANTLIPRGRL